MTDTLDPAGLRSRLLPMRPQLLPEIVICAAGSGSGLGKLAARPPYWAFAWPGGCLLARYILDNPALAAGRRAIDLGAGCGIVAIAAAKAGATVTAIDIDPLAAETVGINAGLNGLELAVEIADPLGGAPPAADLVLVGDLFYEARLAKRVAHYLDRCRAAGSDILVGDIGRRHLPREELLLLASYDVAAFGSSQPQPGAVYRWRTKPV